MSKKFEIKNGDISDGYHTFDELYEHRIALFIRLCHSRNECYIQKEHFKGWDAVYLNLPEGQISYHIPVKYREYLPYNIIEVGSDFYDGHTSQQVLDRLVFWKNT